MPALFEDAVMDGTLDQIAAATRIVVCSQQPTSYADLTTYGLAETTLSAADFTKANGDSSGRKLTRAAKTGVAVTASGTATYIGYGISASSTLIGSVPCASTSLTASGTVDIGASVVTLPDPA